MKTNLDKHFKSNKTSEENGVWFDISNDTGFLVKRFGGFNAPEVKAKLAKYYKPYAKLIELGTLEESKEKEIMVRVFVESCMKDWKGVVIDDVDTPFSPDIAVKFLLALPDLADTLISHATDSKNYRADVGNF